MSEPLLVQWPSSLLRVMRLSCRRIDHVRDLRFVPHAEQRAGDEPQTGDGRDRTTSADHIPPLLQSRCTRH